MVDRAEVLRLIEQAVLTLQSREHPGRPTYYALERLYREVRSTQSSFASIASPAPEPARAHPQP